MGVLAFQFVDAWRGLVPRGWHDPCPAQKGLRRRCCRWDVAGLIWLALCGPAFAETLRIATYAAPLSRDGPGLLLRDIRKYDDPQITAILEVIAANSPDILVLTDFDFDYDQVALTAFAKAAAYPYAYSRATNGGVPTGLDLDGNGRLGEARDMQGYGRFLGDGGMAVLSRYPIDSAGVTDLSEALWADQPGAQLPDTMTPEVAAVQRLSSAGHWIIPVMAPDGPVHVLASSHTPPVFDGPEDRNGLRNRDELRMWLAVLDGRFGAAPADFVLAANLNLDPKDGEGLLEALQAFLADPRLQDPWPTSEGGRAANSPDHIGDPGTDTADWAETGPGNLRVSYVLPATSWKVLDSGVFWPESGTPAATLLGDDGLVAGPHHLVWVDVGR